MPTTTDGPAPAPAPRVRGTLLAADLARIIDDAAIFACRSAILPSINAVHLESTAKHVVAVATDRFTLGSAMAEYHKGGGPTFTATFKLAQAQILAKVAKSTRANYTDVMVRTDDDGGATFAFASGEKLTLPTARDDSWTFPNWRKILTDRADEDAPTQALAVSPQLLAKFARVSDSRQMVVKLAGESRPALVTIGSQFVGLVMPQRISDEAELTAPLPSWLVKPKRKPRARKAADQTAVSA